MECINAEKDENGSYIDPITYEPIPNDCLFVLELQNKYRYCYNARSLYKLMVTQILSRTIPHLPENRAEVPSPVLKKLTDFIMDKYPEDLIEVPFVVIFEDGTQTEVTWKKTDNTFSFRGAEYLLQYRDVKVKTLKGSFEITWEYGVPTVEADEELPEEFLKIYNRIVKAQIAPFKPFFSLVYKSHDIEVLYNRDRNYCLFLYIDNKMNFSYLPEFQVASLISRNKITHYVNKRGEISDIDDESNEMEVLRDFLNSIIED